MVRIISVYSLVEVDRVPGQFNSYRSGSVCSMAMRLLWSRITRMFLNPPRSSFAGRKRDAILDMVATVVFRGTSVKMKMKMREMVGWAEKSGCLVGFSAQCELHTLTDHHVYL